MEIFEYTNKDLSAANIDQLWEQQWKRIESTGLLRYDQPRENPNVKFVESEEGFKIAFQYLLNRGSKRLELSVLINAFAFSGALGFSSLLLTSPFQMRDFTLARLTLPKFSSLSNRLIDRTHQRQRSQMCPQ